MSGVPTVSRRPPHTGATGAATGTDVPSPAGARAAPAAEPRWLAEVRLRAARRVLWLRHLWSGHHYEDEHLLAISHSEVDRALAPRAELGEAEREFYGADERAAAISAQLAVLAERPEDARLQHLVQVLELGALEAALLALCLATAADPALGRVFGYLQDVTEPVDPTPSLAAKLYDLTGEPLPGPGSALVRWLVAEPVLAGRDAYAGATGWRADTMLLGTLCVPSPASGTDPAARAAALAAADWSAGAPGERVPPPPEPVLRERTVEEVVSFLRQLPAGTAVEVELVGAAGSGRTTVAAQAAERLGLHLVAVDAEQLAARPDVAAAVVRAARRARLEGAVIAIEGGEAMSGELWRLLPPAPVTFLSVETPTPHAGFGAVRRSFACPPIGRGDRLTLWSSLSEAPAPAAVAEWALRPAEIRVASEVAPAGEHEVAEVCRRLLMAGTPELLSPLPLPFTWDDLVLSPVTRAHLHELEAQARDRGEVLDEWGFARLTALGRGTTALFAGPSGTGKTMASQVLARALGLALYRVDLAGVVSKYIGETEKHLRQVFEACERAPVLLLFDEADALFGKRTQVSDAHDRYANIEIDYVLQRMEQFDGLAVLATNRKGDLDTAFVRRLRFIVDFAPPSAPERERLWRLALEGAHDRHHNGLVDDLDWAALGRDLDLTGAGIKSAALAAAFLARTEGARIGTRHVLAAARRELEKQGVVVRPGKLEVR